MRVRWLTVGAVIMTATWMAGQAPARLTVTSPVLTAGDTIPRDYTADGRNVSPPLHWTGAPSGTRSFAVICDDPDAPTAQPFVHWVLYNIPASATALPENLPIDPALSMPAGLDGAVHGVSGFKRAMYRGPAPPPGKPHHYHFKVYATDLAPNLKPGFTKADLLDAMSGHVLAEGELVAIYERRPQPSPGP